MDTSTLQKVQMIPIDNIHVLNPRERNQRKFEGIVENIASLGLKRPITVSRRKGGEDRGSFNLVCGQGRIEAFQELGQREIPAIVIEVDEHQCMLMSLVENLARRQHRPLELLREIENLKQRGYSFKEIASKIDLSVEHVRGVAKLLTQGEDRLLTAVETGQIPLYVAMKIAQAEAEDVREALAEAYEQKHLNRRELGIARRLVERRRRRGKGLRATTGAQRVPPLSTRALVRTYRREVDRQRLLVKKAELVRNRLLFIVEALRCLFDDDHLVTLLRAESMDTVPQYLTDKMAKATEQRR